MGLGLLTANEIAEEADSAQATLSLVSGAAAKLCAFQKKHNPHEIVFTGCGSSYYLAICGAFLLESFTGIRCRALPASEIINHAENLWRKSMNGRELIAISRSGETSETVAAVRAFRERSWGPVLSISGYKNTSMEEFSNLAIILQAAQEKSVVMTNSFTSILLALQYISGLWAADNKYIKKLLTIPKLMALVLPRARALAQTVVSKRKYKNYFFLGAGPRYGLALEGMLKMREMALQDATNAYYPLEVRHGPISTVKDDTLVILLQGHYGRDHERTLIADLKHFGADVLVVPGKPADEHVKAADFSLDMSFTGDELIDLPLYLPVIQYLGLFTAIREGIDPDRPRNLSQVVKKI